MSIFKQFSALKLKNWHLFFSRVRWIYRSSDLSFFTWNALYSPIGILTKSKNKIEENGIRDFSVTHMFDSLWFSVNGCFLEKEEWKKIRRRRSRKDGKRQKTFGLHIFRRLSECLILENEVVMELWLILREMSIVEQCELWFDGKLKKYCEINPLEV